MDAVIWTEGIADQKFLADAIGHWFGLKFERTNVKKNGKDAQIFKGSNGNLTIDIQSLVGKDTILNEKQAVETLKDQFSFNRNQGKLNIVFLDADDNIEERFKEVDQSKSFMDENFPAFLLPNNESIGDLETLLENIANPINEAIFECWNNYENCLEGKENPANPGKTFTLPARKTKIYAYLEALLGSSKKQKELIKEPNRDYTNPKHWDLNHEYLEPLKTFLNQHLKVQPA